MLLTTFVLALAPLAAQAAGASPATPAKSGASGKVMSVDVQAAGSAPEPVRTWVQELKTALTARHDEFRLVRAPQKAELVVKIDSVTPASNGRSVMSGAILVAARARPFNLTYSGPSAPQAEKLARHLRALAEQPAATPAPAKKK